MLTDFVEELHKSSDQQIEQFELAIKKEKAARQINEILEAAKQARQEHAEGKTYVASTPEEIIQWFKDVTNEKD